MKSEHHICRSLLISYTLLAVTLLCSLPVGAQQITGVPGSPSATTTVSNKQLPPPDPKFGGVIKEDALQSKPWWAPRAVPPKGAPNVLLIITDDAGFGNRTADDYLSSRTKAMTKRPLPQLAGRDDILTGGEVLTDSLLDDK